MILVGLSGCVAQGASGGAGAPMESEYALGKKLVQEVFSVYRNYSRDSFDVIVSRDFNPIRSEYVNAVERGFYGAQQLDLYPIVDSVVTNRDLMSVSFRWEKKRSLIPAGISGILPDMPNMYSGTKAVNGVSTAWTVMTRFREVKRGSGRGRFLGTLSKVAILFFNLKKIMNGK